MYFHSNSPKYDFNIPKLIQNMVKIYVDTCETLMTNVNHVMDEWRLIYFNIPKQ